MTQSNFHLTFYIETMKIINDDKIYIYQNLEQLEIDGLPHLVKTKGNNEAKMDVEDKFALLNLGNEKLELHYCRRSSSDSNLTCH